MPFFGRVTPVDRTLPELLFLIHLTTRESKWLSWYLFYLLFLLFDWIWNICSMVTAVLLSNTQTNQRIDQREETSIVTKDTLLLDRDCVECVAELTECWWIVRLCAISRINDTVFKTGQWWNGISIPHGLFLMLRSMVDAASGAFCLKRRRQDS